MDNAWTTHALARRFIEALDVGQVPPGLREELATAGATLGERLARLAAEVSAGGPHAWRRAIELAELLHGFVGERETADDVSRGGAEGR